MKPEIKEVLAHQVIISYPMNNWWGDIIAELNHEFMDDIWVPTISSMIAFDEHNEPCHLTQDMKDVAHQIINSDEFYHLWQQELS